MRKQSATATAIEAAQGATVTYTLGDLTKKQIVIFVNGLIGSERASVTCLNAANEVAQDFPKWEKKSAAYSALGKGIVTALKASGMKDGSAKGYATHFSNIVRCAQLPKIAYSVGKRKDGTDILKHSTGLAYFKSFGNFTDARHAAKVIAKKYGLTNGKGRTAAVKVLDKAAILDLIDKTINAVRITEGFDKTLLPMLIKARTVAHGSASENGAIKAERIKGYAQLSRGQKAAATRRANQAKPLRNTRPQPVGSGINMPVLH